MCYRHFNIGQFNDLVRIIRTGFIKMCVSAYAQLRDDIFHFGGLKHLLPKALPSPFLLGLTLFLVLRLFLESIV